MKNITPGSQQGQLDKKTTEQYCQLGLLYNKISGITTKYSDDSGDGPLEIARVIEGRSDIFIKALPDEVLEKKKIIIADGLLSHSIYPRSMQSESLSASCEKWSFYSQLKRDGFELYGYIKGRLERIYEYQQLRDLGFATEEELKKKAAALGIPGDELYIAGTFNSLKFIYMQEYSFEQTMLLNLSEQQARCLLYDLKRKQLVKIKLNLLFPHLFEDMPQLILEQVDKVQFTSEIYQSTQFQTLTERYPHLREKFVLPTLPKIPSPSLQDMTELEIESPGAEESTNLSDVFAQYPALQTVTIRNRERKFEAKRYSRSSGHSGYEVDKSFAPRENLLPGSALHSKELLFKEPQDHETQMLPIVRALSIENYEKRCKVKIPVSLQSLTLKGCVISWEYLSLMLARSPHIYFLTLSDVTIKGEVGAFRLPSSITRLGYEQTDENAIFPGEQLSLFLSDTKNLLSVDIIGNQLSKDIIILPPSIVRYRGKQECKVVLNQCPNIETLIGLEIDDLPSSAGLCTSLTLTCLVSEEINLLFAHFPHLTSLKFLGLLGKGYLPLQWNQDIKISPTNLARISLSHQTFSWSCLKEIIDCSPNLQMLKIQDCKITGPVIDITFPTTIVEALFIGVEADLAFLQSLQDKYPRTVVLTNNVRCKPIVFNLDSDTEDFNPTYEVKEIFKEKPGDNNSKIRLQRLIILSHYNSENCMLSSSAALEDKLCEEVAPSLGRSEAMTLEQLYDSAHEASPEHFLGRITVETGCDFVSLPSISNRDELLAVEVPPGVGYRTLRSREEDLFYLQFNPPLRETIEIYFMIKSSESLSEKFKDTSSAMDLPPLKFTSEGRLDNLLLAAADEEEKISALTRYFREFTCAPLSNTMVSSDSEKLKLLIEEKKGVCRHRSIGFVAVAQSLGLRARVVKSSVHSFIEVHHSGEWHAIDLGGGRATLKIKSFKSVAAEEKAKAKLLAAKALAIAQEADVSTEVVEDRAKMLEAEVLTNTTRAAEERKYAVKHKASLEDVSKCLSEFKDQALLVKALTTETTDTSRETVRRAIRAEREIIIASACLRDLLFRFYDRSEDEFDDDDILYQVPSVKALHVIIDAIMSARFIENAKTFVAAANAQISISEVLSSAYNGLSNAHSALRCYENCDQYEGAIRVRDLLKAAIESFEPHLEAEQADTGAGTVVEIESFEPHLEAFAKVLAAVEELATRYAANALAQLAVEEVAPAAAEEAPPAVAFDYGLSLQYDLAYLRIIESEAKKAEDNGRAASILAGMKRLKTHAEILVKAISAAEKLCIPVAEEACIAAENLALEAEEKAFVAKARAVAANAKTFVAATEAKAQAAAKIAEKAKASAEKESNISTNPFVRQNAPVEVATMNQYVKYLYDASAPLAQRNILCILTKEQIEPFYQAILRKGQPTYFISDLEKVSLTGVRIPTSSGSPEFVDSALGKFTKLKDVESALVVDWSDAKPQHVGLNSMIDADRYIGSTPLDPQCRVISLLERGSAMGEDFYSRHRIVSYMPRSLKEDLELAVLREAEALPIAASSGEDGSITINFYDNHWQAQLFGKISLSGSSGYIYQESLMVTSLKEGQRKFTLRNAPWGDREFRLAIRDIESKGLIYVNGEEHSYQRIRFIRDDTPYSREGLKTADFTAIEDAEIVVVNQTTFHRLFEEYRFIDGNLHVLEGELARLESNPNLRLLVTENLTDGQWARLAGCGATVIDYSSAADKALIPGNTSATIIETNDLGMALAEYAIYPGKPVIHINPTTKASDLVERLKYDPASKTFTYKPAIVGEMLRDADLMEPPSKRCRAAIVGAVPRGADLVLVGTPSKQLAGELESLFIAQPYLRINGQRQELYSTVTLITEPGQHFVSFNRQRHNYSEEQIWEKLLAKHSATAIEAMTVKCATLYQALPDVITPFNYTQLDAILRRSARKPDSNPFKHILRLHPNYQAIRPKLEELWPKHRVADASRPELLDKVKEELAHSHCVSLVGSSGVGKSRFVQRELALYYEIVEGLENLPRLAEKGSDKPILLFLDEANLSANPEEYEALQGLRRNPPQLLINGKLVDIPEENRVIFGGNYSHYKDRQRIRIAEENGSIIAVKEQSDKTLTEGVMLPILDRLFAGRALGEANTNKQVAEIFLRVYHQINSTFPQTHPLTARNLQMMCVRSYILCSTPLNQVSAAFMAAYDEVSPLLSKDARLSFRIYLESLSEGMNIKATKAGFKNAIKIEGTVTTRTRKNIVRLLGHLLAARDLKQQGFVSGGDGINGYIIEGSAGIGKSYIPQKMLESIGYRKADWVEDTGALCGESAVSTSCATGGDGSGNKNMFYVITPTNFAQAQAILLKAFHEGAIVIINEINTLPLEKILNALLSGVDLEGKSARENGFTVIGTQNPISYGRRLGFSAALNNRLPILHLKDYSEEELIQVLRNPGDDVEMQADLSKQVHDFTVARRYMIRHGEQPPNYRELFAAASQKRENRSEDTQPRGRPVI